MNIKTLNTQSFRFIECDACRAKPGAPTLCFGCLANRALIEHLCTEINLAGDQAALSQREAFRNKVVESMASIFLGKDEQSNERRMNFNAGHNTALLSLLPWIDSLEGKDGE